MNFFSRHKLSPQEIRVCELLLLGYTIQQIAVEMDRAYKTIQTYKYRAFSKLGIDTEIQLYRDYVRALLDDIPSIPDAHHVGRRNALYDVLTINSTPAETRRGIPSPRSAGVFLINQPTGY